MAVSSSAALTRRMMLAGLGCSLAASPLVTPMTFAATPGDNRLVVLILRGAMDGLDVLRPVGDPDFADLRRVTLGKERAIPLDGFFEMHPALGDLKPMWDAGELGFAHAVATPYRDKRSHFDGQDILEAGIVSNDGVPTGQDGWLNRLVASLPGARAETAFAIGRGELRILTGAAPTSTWAPQTQLELTPHAERLLELVYHDDPLFRDAAASALTIVSDLEEEATMGDEDVEMGSMMSEMGVATSNKALLAMTEFAINRLRRDTRIASYSITGWDTHAGQANRIGGPLRNLAGTINAMKIGLGPEIWGKTTILALTEFGRTARENGSQGTDHGTGGAILMAGGAVRGGRVYGDWPGLAEADLYDRRDLMPTADVRSYAGWAMRGLYGLGVSDLERGVFPGLDMGRDPGIILG